MSTKRTDLAIEAKEIWDESAVQTTKLEGVIAEERSEGSVRITTVQITDERGEEALGKPKGTYITIELSDNCEEDACEALRKLLLQLLDLGEDDSVLVAGLGNAAITPDAIGPKIVRGTVVTRHLAERMPEQFGAFRPVSAIETGVLGTTGIESAEIVKAVVEKAAPERVIVVDALASRRLSRVCKTIQLTDTGIIPGSGVGNGRAAINSKTLGVPVIAVGVPTVVDAATLALDLAEQAGAPRFPSEEISGAAGGMIVTPREIDAKVTALSKLVSVGINLALQDGLTTEDIGWILAEH